MSVASEADEFQENVEDASSTNNYSTGVSLPCTLAHQGYTLVGFAFVVFECCFLILYSNEFWIGFDLSSFGALAAIMALIAAHFILSWAESPSGCNFFSPIFKRKPPMVYRRWLRLNEPGFAPGFGYGERHVIWKAVDEVELTFWGNLCVMTRAICGPTNPEKKAPRRPFSFSRLTDAEEILKFPFSVASLAAQKSFVQTLQQNNPSVKLNSRLTKRLEAKDVPGTTYVQQLGAVFLFVVLLDVGYSMFSYLEILKNYYLTETTMQSDNIEDKKNAPIFFERAEKIRLHPLPFSWVSNKIMHEGKIASGIYLDRSEALWALGRKEESIQSTRKALDLAPTSFRLNLRLARLLSNAGHTKEALAQSNDAVKNHDSAFLPRLYMLALRPEASRQKFYKIYLSDLDDELFGNDLMWPPGSHVFAQDVWYRDDVTFIFDRLFKLNGRPPSGLNRQ